MANPGSSCYAGAVVQGLISAGLDQALDKGANMDPQYAQLHRVLETVGQARRDPARPAVDPSSLIKALNNVTSYPWKVDKSESASHFLESVLDSVELLPQSLTTFEEVGSCGECGRNYRHVSAINHHWITVPLIEESASNEPVTRARAMLNALPSGRGTLFCTRDQEEWRPCRMRQVPSKLQQVTGE